MQTVSVLVALFLFESVFHTSAYNASLFIKLLELQLEECPAVSFCTFRSPNLSVESRLATCCRNCSCDADCVEQGTCCPDIQLTTFIGEEVSNNISELSDRIKSTNVTIGMQLQQPESEPRNKQENLPCVQANALTNIIIHTKRENAYRMIDSCPKTYMDNLEIARKCTDGKYQDIGFNDPNIYIPVTSMQTKTSYQNIFCYWCNEETQATNSLRQWKVKMFCSYGEYSHSCDNPYGCFRQVNRISKAYCEISFEPRADVQPHVSRCDPIDVQTCPNHSDVQLREVCRAFHLPVFAQDVFITFKRYKNIACYLCNREEMFKSYCAGSLSEREGYDLELNFQLDENDIIMSYNETEQHVLNVSIVQEEGFQCPTGFLQNSERVACDRVLCPILFYPQNGLCYPLFTHLENIFFTAMFDVRRIQKLDQASRNKFRQVYVDRVSATAAELFQQFTYGLWQIENNYDIFVISFIMFPSKNTYVDMLMAFSEFQKQIGILKIKTGSASVLTVTTISNSPTLVFIGETLRADRKDLKAVRKYKKPDKRFNEMYVSNANLCYRIELSENEADMYHDIVGLKDKQMLSSSFEGGMIVCIDVVYQNLTNINSSYMFAGHVATLRAEFIKLKQTFKPKTSKTVDNSADINIIEDNDSENDAFSDESKGLFAVLMFVVVTAIICILKFVKYRKEKMSRIETPELSELES